MLRRLPPVGSPVTHSYYPDAESVFSSVFGEQSVFCYGSGTMALAAALVATKKYRKIPKAEILLPAYACPDIISAALYAEIKPVIVDLEADTPWMDLDKLKSQITSRTIAVVAVHFLGIAERITKIRELLCGSDIKLIEDSAQLFPQQSIAGIWEGDLIILSFGRGKPVSLLGGGAVICKNKTLQGYLPRAKEALFKLESESPSLSLIIKYKLYNQLLNPWWFGLLDRLPFLHIGETKYKPLETLNIANKELLSTLIPNINAYINRDLNAQKLVLLMLAELGDTSIVDLPARTSNNRLLPLLRYPLLVNSQKKRNILYDKLSTAGLGVSIMYPEPLPEIQGIQDIFKNQINYNEAKRFSQRLLTLPCHIGISKADIEKIAVVMNEAIGK